MRRNPSQGRSLTRLPGFDDPLIGSGIGSGAGGGAAINCGAVALTALRAVPPVIGFLNAKLVVLSACNTAAGEKVDEDGLSGLARAFFWAGAKSLLVIHWSVYSDAVVDLSTRSFSALESGQNQPFPATLRAATLDILADPNRSAFHYHPSYWAAFSIIGAT